MLERGLYLPCSQFEANFVSAAHTDADIDQTIGTAVRSWRKWPLRDRPGTIPLA